MNSSWCFDLWVLWPPLTSFDCQRSLQELQCNVRLCKAAFYPCDCEVITVLQWRWWIVNVLICEAALFVVKNNCYYERRRMYYVVLLYAVERQISVSVVHRQLKILHYIRRVRKDFIRLLAMPCCHRCCCCCCCSAMSLLLLLQCHVVAVVVFVVVVC